mmetsp:Transcript_13184/g.33860  ORF Transcript_13184/g.33860 Transcript_13184/m.33860 type:complete len:326 (-) Transcript_13184:77-1054(-)
MAPAASAIRLDAGRKVPTPGRTAALMPRTTLCGLFLACSAVRALPRTSLEIGSKGVARRGAWTRRGLSRCFAAHSASNSCPVAEFVFLCKMKDGVDEAEAEEVVNALWSLQYAVPGCVCGSGGSVISQQIPTAVAETEKYVEPTAWSHAVHIRLGSLRAVPSFRANPAVQAAVNGAMTHCDHIDEVAWASSVASDLGSIYRQGDEWSTGVEHLLMIVDNPGYGDGVTTDLPLMISQLGEVAESSKAGAVQCSGGIALEETTIAMSGLLMARFMDAMQLDTFTRSPPYQALWDGNKRLPGQALINVTFNVAPADEQQTVGIADGFL